MSQTTQVSLSRKEGVHEFRLLFGEVDRYTPRDVYSAEPHANISQKQATLSTLNPLNPAPSYAHFQPGKIVGYSRWHSNQYGTLVWDIYVVRTCRAGEEAVKIPGVFPGIDLLLHTQGKHYCSKLIALLKSLKGKGLYLPYIPASYYAYVHGRLNVGLPVREPEAGVYEAQLA